MHYVITYDIEDDRLRTQTAKVLQRFGCARVQKSVFVAAQLEKRYLLQLQTALHQLLAKRLKPGESLLVFPLRHEHAPEIFVLGHNNILTTFDDPPRKTLL